VRACVRALLSQRRHGAVGLIEFRALRRAFDAPERIGNVRMGPGLRAGGVGCSA
jgi:hypothetical protein